MIHVIKNVNLLAVQFLVLFEYLVPEYLGKHGINNVNDYRNIEEVEENNIESTIKYRRK